jgi:hypothetical protein
MSAMAQSADANLASLGEELMSCHAGHSREKVALRTAVKLLEDQVVMLKKAAEKP